MSLFLVRVERTIAAPAQQLFDIVADPAQHPVIDGSGSVTAARSGNPERLSKGAKFGMDMKLGAKYPIENIVVEFDEPTLIGWRHFNGHVWRYRFEPVDGGTRTRVIEEWDARRVWNRPLLVLMGFPARNRKGMEKTLERLESHVRA